MPPSPVTIKLQEENIKLTQLQTLSQRIRERICKLLGSVVFGPMSSPAIDKLIIVQFTFYKFIKTSSNSVYCFNKSTNIVSL